MNKKQMVQKFFDDISLITQRPFMFGLNDAYGIDLAMVGYTMGSKSEVLNDFYAEFRNFINNEFAEDFNVKKDYHWTRLIMFYSSDGLNSIKLFDRLFGRFFELYIKNMDVQLENDI